jgi:hypothetical protein
MMTVRVNLRDWCRKNPHYISAWVVMGLVVFALIIKVLGIYTLVLIGPFIPYLVITLLKLRRELKKCVGVEK